MLVTAEPPGGSPQPTSAPVAGAQAHLDSATLNAALVACGAHMATCYRHPNRETGVSCSNCGRPICPDCMTPTSVGMRCPECAAATQVRTAATCTAASRG